MKWGAEGNFAVHARFDFLWFGGDRIIRVFVELLYRKQYMVMSIVLLNIMKGLRWMHFLYNLY